MPSNRSRLAAGRTRLSSSTRWQDGLWIWRELTRINWRLVRSPRSEARTWPIRLSNSARTGCRWSTIPYRLGCERNHGQRRNRKARLKFRSGARLRGYPLAVRLGMGLAARGGSGAQRPARSEQQLRGGRISKGFRSQPSTGIGSRCEVHPAAGPMRRQGRSR
jgi:hypothetical protein